MLIEKLLRMERFLKKCVCSCFYFLFPMITHLQYQDMLTHKKCPETLCVYVCVCVGRVCVREYEYQRIVQINITKTSSVFAS